MTDYPDGITKDHMPARQRWAGVLAWGVLVLLGLLMVTGLWTRLMSSLQGVMANVQLPL